MTQKIDRHRERITMLLPKRTAIGEGSAAHPECGDSSTGGMSIRRSQR